jgi:hypothetical protein
MVAVLFEGTTLRCDEGLGRGPAAHNVYVRAARRVIRCQMRCCATSPMAPTAIRIATFMSTRGRYQANPIASCKQSRC